MACVDSAWLESSAFALELESGKCACAGADSVLCKVSLDSAPKAQRGAKHIHIKKRSAKNVCLYMEFVIVESSLS